MTNPYDWLMARRSSYTCANAGDDEHDTVTVYVRCSHCGEYVIGGYECDTCGHEDSRKPHELPGHGPGMCT